MGCTECRIHWQASSPTQSEMTTQSLSSAEELEEVTSQSSDFNYVSTPSVASENDSTLEESSSSVSSSSNMSRENISVQEALMTSTPITLTKEKSFKRKKKTNVTQDPRMDILVRRLSSMLTSDPITNSPCFQQDPEWSSVVDIPQPPNDIEGRLKNLD